MPMLERTATTLDPCHFQRVLPPSKTPFKSTRRLHTAFWHHGAHAIELSNVWQVLIREPLESLSLYPTHNPSNGSSPSASNFLLDFLYPQGAASLLRKLSPSVLDRYERPRLYLRGTIPRLFTSSASVSTKPRNQDGEGDTDADATAGAVPVSGESAATEEAASGQSDSQTPAPLEIRRVPVYHFTTSKYFNFRKRVARREALSGTAVAQPVRELNRLGNKKRAARRRAAAEMEALSGAAVAQPVQAASDQDSTPAATDGTVAEEAFAQPVQAASGQDSTPAASNEAISEEAFAQSFQAVSGLDSTPAATNEAVAEEAFAQPVQAVSGQDSTPAATNEAVSLEAMAQPFQAASNQDSKPAAPNEAVSGDAFADAFAQLLQGAHQDSYAKGLEPVTLKRLVSGTPLQKRLMFDIWNLYHDSGEPLEYRDRFIDFVITCRGMTDLLVKCLFNGKFQTLWRIWARFPDAHQEGVDHINWDYIDSITKLAGGPDVRAEDRASSPRSPTYHSQKSADSKVMDSIASLVHHIHQSTKSTKPSSSFDPVLSEALLNKFIYPLLERYHRTLRLQKWPNLPKLLKNPRVYEIYILHNAMDPSCRRISDQLYKEYRQLPDVTIHHHVIEAMVHHVYKPVDNAQGMEMVLEDAYERFGKLDITLYRAYIRFYADRRDVRSTQRLFDEYRLHWNHRRSFVRENARWHDPDFLQLLKLWTDRGALSEVRRVFDEAQADFGPKLNTKCWNILLHAHAKAYDYDAAIRVFGVLKQAVPADHFTYATMMGMAGLRGDLEFTLELYRMAKSEDIAPNSVMVDCVVEAYCVNDRFTEAESIVTITTEKQRFSRLELAQLWDTLLYHNARRRDLRALNATLHKMTEFGIKYTSKTYSNLLRGLAWCRQPQHAVFLMKQAVQKKTFKPTLEHYALLMSAFIMTKQGRKALSTNYMVRELGMPETGDMLVRVFQALSDWATRQQHDNGEGKQLLTSMLRQFRTSIDRSNASKDHLPRRNYDGPEPWIEHKPKPITQRQRTEQSAILIHAFTLMRQTADVPIILDLWKKSCPETDVISDPPLRLLSALMHSSFYDGRHDEVRDLWDKIFAIAVTQAKASGPNTPRVDALPALRFSLAEPLKTMQRMHGATDDPDGLRTTVTSVLQAGFRIDSKNWNFYVQQLAGLKRWREAFFACEEHLMPGWRGWLKVRAKNPDVQTRLPLDVRLRGRDPSLPRPTAHTLMVLSKAHLDLEAMSAWSNEAERLLGYIDKNCPASVAAVTNAIRANSELEERIFETGRLKDARDKTAEELALEVPGVPKVGLTAAQQSARDRETAAEQSAHAKAMNAARKEAAERRERGLAGMAERDVEEEKEDEGMPLSFAEMLGQIAGRETGPHGGTLMNDGQDGWGVVDEEEESQAVGDEGGDQAEVKGEVKEEVKEEADDGSDWGDVEEYEEKEWTPRGPLDPKPK